MKTKILRLSIAILFLLASLPITWILTPSRAAETPDSGKQSESAAAGELSQLLKARNESAVRILELAEKSLGEGRGTELEVREAALRARDSALDMRGAPADQLAALTKYVTIAGRIENLMNNRVKAGMAPLSELEFGRYLRLDAEIALVRTKIQENKVR